MGGPPRPVASFFALTLLVPTLAALPVPPGTARAEEPVVAERAPGDTAAQLRSLVEGRLPDDVTVASLFTVSLDRLPEVEARIEALRAELNAIDAARAATQRAETPADTTEAESPAPTPTTASADATSLAVRRQMGADRLRYLEALAERLRDMPEAARRILPGSAEPRSALREHAASVTALAVAVRALAEREEDLAVRLVSGALVGFVSEARDVAESVRSSAADFRARADRLDQEAARQQRLAESLEAESRALRRSLFVSLLAEDRQARTDALFLEHIEEQRRLQREAPDEIIDRAVLDRLTQDVASTADLREIGSVGIAAAVAESVAALAARTDAVIESSSGLRTGWRLAFENEVVTILAGLASPPARREAYAFSTSLLRDVRAEAGLAWERARRIWQGTDEEGGIAVEAFGLDWLLRLFGIAAVIAVWWLARRHTGRFVTRGVQAVARAARQRFGIRIGTVVRWSGLLQSILPTLLAYPAIRIAMAMLANDTAAALLGAIALPLFWYALGRQALLGATRRITWGRPALIEVSPKKLPVLRHTYARLGLVVAVAAILDAFARIAIGDGVIVWLVDGTAVLWVGVWAAWEAIGWRPALAETWQAMLPEKGAKFERAAAEWMARSRLGFVLSPFVVVRRFARWLVEQGVALSRRTDLAGMIAARRLRKAAKSEEAVSGAPTIPEAYLREFPLKPILGEDDALLLPRDATVKTITGQIERWREAKSYGSIALVGEKGAGKTTLAALVAREVEHDVVQHTLRGKPADANALFRDLAPTLPVNGAADFQEWVEGLCAGPERVVLLDEAHNVFLRVVGGYRAYDALVDLVNATSGRIFWVLLFNTFTWRFLNESRSRLHYFRKLVDVPSWNADELRDLIRRRNRQTGFEVEFDELLLDGERGGAGLELVEGADGYFRLLRETSGGNPRIATRLWLSSLSLAGEKRLRVSTFREPDASVLDGMSDDLLFALAAICQHENLSTDELRRVLNVPEGLARFAMQYLTESGLVVEKDGSADRVTLSAPYYRQTLRALRQKHLLFE